MLLTMVKLALMGLSYLGWWEYFREKWKLNVCFVPAVTLGVQFMLLFLPGLLNFLWEGALVVYVLGLLLLVSALRREKLGFLRAYCNWGYGVFLAMLAFAVVAVRGKQFAGIDNFTHWAVVVKNMLAADRFPTFAQSAVSFVHYPLGTSTLIYYFCRLTNQGEDMQMLAQIFIMLSMFLTVFGFAEGRKAICGALGLALVNFLLVYNIPVTDLLVDTVLPMTAAAMLLVLYRGCQETAEEKQLWAALPLMILTMNIKTSGILFLAWGVGMGLLCLKGQREKCRILGWMCLVLAVFYFLWARHYDYVFVGAEKGLHAVSMSHYSTSFLGKTGEDIQTIVWGTLRYAFTRREFWWLLGGEILCGVTFVFAQAGERRRALSILLGQAGLYAIYVIGLTAMYLFSMRGTEATDLTSIDRYMKTIDICLYVLLAACAMTSLGRIPRDALAGAAGAVLLLATIGLWKDTCGLQTIYQAGGGVI